MVRDAIHVDDRFIRQNFIPALNCYICLGLDPLCGFLPFIFVLLVLPSRVVD